MISPKLGRTLGAAALLSLLYTTTALSADDLPETGSLPAVSGFNGKLDFSYIYVDAGGTLGEYQGAAAVGSATVPLGHSFGLQIDAGLGRFDAGSPIGDFDSAGIGAHLFARDPALGLIGAYAHYVNVDFGAAELESFKYGVELEYYHNQFTIEAFAGGTRTKANGITLNDANLDFTAAYYVNDNFRVEAGAIHQFDETFGKIGFEAALPIFNNNTSLYANASFNDDQSTVRAGLRIYLSDDSGKSLKDRHRQDDPKDRLLDFSGLDVEKFQDAPVKFTPIKCGEYSRCAKL